jgi:hypothetical protein
MAQSVAQVRKTLKKALENEEYVSMRITNVDKTFVGRVNSLEGYKGKAEFTRWEDGNWFAYTLNDILIVEIVPMADLSVVIEEPPVVHDPGIAPSDPTPSG